MRGGIHQPGSVQPNHGAQENAPQNQRDASPREKRYTDDNHLNVMIFGDPYIKLVLRKIRNVTRKSGSIVVHGLAGENPAHVRPPGSVNWRVRVAFFV